MRVFYFGCIERSGHFFWSPGPRSDGHAENIIPWERVDGILCPGATGDPDRPTWQMNRPQTQGEAALHHKDGWTALAFWDRSVDERGGCNSALFAEGTHTFKEMTALFQEHFPQVWDRFKFKVQLAVEPAEVAT